MDIIVVCSLIVSIICVIMLIFVLIYNNYQSYIIRINEVETSIDTILRKRFDLVCKCIDVIRNFSKDDAFLDIIDLKEQKISNFDLDRKIIGTIIKFDSYRDKYDDLDSNDVFIKSCIALNDSEVELEAYKKYYNNIVTQYNKRVKQFPSDIVAKLSHFNVKPYFDGKNMYDDITDDFKL